MASIIYRLFSSLSEDEKKQLKPVQPDPSCFPPTHPRYFTAPIKEFCNKETQTDEILHDKTAKMREAKSKRQKKKEFYDLEKTI